MNKHIDTILTVFAVIAIESAKIALSAAVAILVASKTIPVAEEFRGYSGAVGGEGVLIIGSAVLTYYLLTLFIKKLKGSD